MPVDVAQPHSGRREVFVYYTTLAAAGEPRILQAYAALARRLAHWQPELMRRADGAAAGKGLQTWMEVYRLDGSEPADLEQLQGLIEAAARDAGILAIVDGERHYEVFDSCA